MNAESFQDTLFEDPIGLRFRHAREKNKWSLESVAQQLKLPVAVLDAIEREDWSRLGAPIFVRSYVGSYAKILGLPATLADEVVRGKPAPQLVSIGGMAPAGRSLDRGIMNLAYLALTIVIVGSVVAVALYFQSPKRAAVVLPLDAPAAYASMAPATAGGASARPSEIVLYFRDQSWVDIVDRKGGHLERGLLAAGTERRFAPDQLSNVTLGDASAVEVRQAGVALDLTPFRDANIARFTVSSDGTIVAPSGG